ncbi:hypothetical protein GCM10016455_05910 [Aliiroseovarius zhejiangensis]|uniref:Uncharacterized protein n=1 Tax=Aliiroseovarius zhejiangensis TaxID=1632025 RepID=A0ABQ3ISF9_9RHOB|nr:hypothetical protein [Aliiroseovarius zhejiangensis]GHE88596.1 hypothetical protein GCM10016455_05910 [Aliiroseovarius zhejiangensis]
MISFTVEHRPEEANPADLSWCVLKHGRPHIWFRHEVYAEGFAIVSNRGANMISAQKFVKAMPDDLKEAEAYIHKLKDQDDD